MRGDEALSASIPLLYSAVHCIRYTNASAPAKDVHVPIPRTCEYVTLHGKWVFAYVIKIRNLR